MDLWDRNYFSSISPLPKSTNRRQCNNTITTPEHIRNLSFETYVDDSESESENVGDSPRNAGRVHVRVIVLSRVSGLVLTPNAILSKNLESTERLVHY